MAYPRLIDEERGTRPRRRSYSEWEDSQRHRSRGKKTVTQSHENEEFQRGELEREDGHRGGKCSSATMPAIVSESRTTLNTLKSSSNHRRRRHGSSEEAVRRRRRKSSARDDEYHVHRSRSSHIRSKSSHRSIRERSRGDDSETRESDVGSTVSEPVEVKPRKRRTTIIYVTEHESVLHLGPRPKERRSRKDRDAVDLPKERTETVRRSRVSHTRHKSSPNSRPPSPLQRSASTRDLPSQPRPSLRRSNTTTLASERMRGTQATSTTNSTSTYKRSTFLNAFLGPSPQPHREPEKLVECLTCLSDDIPRSKSAKLKCGHRMCHACLKRIFKLSVTDPQHMPPKCCTSDCIPLKHVERLFSIEFKKNWNRKYQEYTTKNRIYCPGRRCGEWIKPGNIHKEDGRKYGKCSRCKLKVCCLCNGKWHGSKECPKDEETNALLEAAKQAGWQRCYSCRTMVELKEGCNHMTCRCTAEFCMICGLKWKTCNCPWFNYDAVEQDRRVHEADRLNHMRVPENPAAQNEQHQQEQPQNEQPRNQDQPQRPHRLRRPPRPPTNYDEEMSARRRQELEDERLARRLQRMAVADNIDGGYQGGIGDIHGIGNGAAHFMNQNYVRTAQNILAGPFDQATRAANYVMQIAQARGPVRPAPGPLQPAAGPRRVPPPPAQAYWQGIERRGSPPPILRRHTMREHTYNSAQSTRPEERVVPRRTRTDYASEAAVHDPARRSPQRLPAATPPDSVLAGLAGAGRYANRVGAWRRHVEAGPPEDGVITMP